MKTMNVKIKFVTGDEVTVERVDSIEEEEGWITIYFRDEVIEEKEMRVRTESILYYIY